MPEFSIGADPEVFVTKKGKGVSAHGLIPGTKDSPHKVPRGAVQVDGMATEFNTDPVLIETQGFEVFNTNVVQQLKNLRELLPKEVNLTITPVMEFDQKTMDEAPDEAKELGCDPDYNAYTLEANPRPEGDVVNFRTGAGHIHVGWGQGIPVDNMDHMRICADFVKVLDCTVGLFMTFIDREPRRRQLYGKAGAMRMKPYGVEYRTPSNEWIKTRDRRFLIFTLVNQAIQWRRSGISDASKILMKGSSRVSQDEVVRIINEGDYAAAKQILTSSIFGKYSDQWNNVIAEMEKKEAS